MMNLAPKKPHPLAMAVPHMHALPGLPGAAPATVRPIGLASPWKINPGTNPAYPNHHPFMSHLGPPLDLQRAKGK